MRATFRRSLNGVVVVMGLLVALPLVVAVERVRAGAGSRVARGAVRGIAALCGIRFVVTGAGGLDAAGAYVFVPNHASPVDIPAMLLVRPGLHFVAAAELFRVPLLGGAMRALGAIPVDRSRPARNRGRLSQEATATTSVVVFAEGGIPDVGEARRFRTGAFVLAIESGVPVVPVTIRGSADVLPRGSRIWARPGVITVECHPPIATTGMSIADR